MPSAMRVLFIEFHFTFTLLKTAIQTSISNIGTFFIVIGGTSPHTMEKIGIQTINIKIWRKHAMSVCNKISQLK